MPTARNINRHGYYDITLCFVEEPNTTLKDPPKMKLINLKKEDSKVTVVKPTKCILI